MSSDPTPPPTISGTIHGSCHCGHVTYTITLPAPVPAIAERCNCSICVKTQFTSLHLPKNPPSTFKLLTPSSLADVPTYRFGSGEVARHFCALCGVPLFIGGEDKEAGGEFWAVNVGTLDGLGEMGFDPRGWRMRYWDGKSNGWEKGGRDVPWEGGMV